MNEVVSRTVQEAEDFIRGKNDRFLTIAIVSRLLGSTGQGFLVSEGLLRAIPSQNMIASLLMTAHEITCAAGGKSLKGSEVYEIDKELVTVYAHCPCVHLDAEIDLQSAGITEAMDVIGDQAPADVFRSLHRLASAFDNIIVVDGEGFESYEPRGLGYLAAAAQDAMPPMTSFRTWSYVIDTRRPSIMTAVQLYINRQGGPMPCRHDQMFEMSDDLKRNQDAIPLQAFAPDGPPPNTPLH